MARPASLHSFVKCTSNTVGYLGCHYLIAGLREVNVSRSIKYGLEEILWSAYRDRRP